MDRRDNETGELVPITFDEETGERILTQKIFKIPSKLLKFEQLTKKKRVLFCCREDVIYFIMIMTIVFTCPAWGSLLVFFIEYCTHQCDSDNLLFMSCPGASMFFCTRCRIRHHANIISRMKDREISKRTRYAAICATT